MLYGKVTQGDSVSVAHNGNSLNNAPLTCFLLILVSAISLPEEHYLCSSSQMYQYIPHSPRKRGLRGYPRRTGGNAPPRVPPYSTQAGVCVSDVKLSIGFLYGI